MFHNLISLHSFFFWLGTDAHIRSLMDHQILCWNIIRQCPSYSITLEVLSPLVNPILWLTNHALLSSLCYLLLKFVVYVPKRPRWVRHMPFLICVNPGTTTGHTLVLLCQIKFQHNFVEGEKWMKGYALEKWESTLNFVFMHMDTLYIFSSKLLLKSIIPWV